MSYFPHTNTEDKSDTKAKTDIFNHLIHYRNSLAIIEADYIERGIGKKAVREVVSKTTFLLCILLLAQIFLSFLNAYIFAFVLYAIYLLLCFAIPKSICLLSIDIDKLRKNIKEKSSSLINPDDQNKTSYEELKKFYERISQSDDKTLLFSYYLASNKNDKLTWYHKFVRYFILQSPFSLRIIWFWTLIIGIALVFNENDVQLIYDTGYNNSILNKFSFGILKALVVAVLSYIATNIISELLQLREQYVQGIEEMLDLKKVIIESSKIVNNAKGILEDAVERITIIGTVTELNDSLQALKLEFLPADKKINHILAKTFDGFLNTVEKQFKTFKEKCTKDHTIKLWVTSAINNNIKIHTKLYEKRNELVTTFEAFGEILNNTIEYIIEDKDTNKDIIEYYEIYTILVLPPGRFFNFNEYNGKLLRAFFAANESWKKYVDVNLKASKAGIKQFRHFLSISNERNLNNMGEEEKDLASEKVKKQLNEKYYLLKEEKTNYDIFCEEKEVADDLGKKIKAYEYLETSTPYKTDKIGYEWKSLSDILNIIHKVGETECCKVLEVPVNSYEGPSRMNRLIRNNLKMKPIDYYAIRHKKNDAQWEWLLCFRTEYDKSFNAAIIRIMHKEQDAHENEKKEWQEMCEKLNTIFLINTVPDHDGTQSDSELGIKIIPINKYNQK